MSGAISGIVKVSWLCSTFRACDWKFIQIVINVYIEIGQEIIQNVAAYIVGTVHRQLTLTCFGYMALLLIPLLKSVNDDSRNPVSENLSLYVYWQLKLKITKVF